MNWEYSTYSKVDSDVANHFPFTKARENQLETISEIKHAIDKGYKYIILEAGTGTGKSAIAATLALMYDSTYILTVTKQLQDQYLNDFSQLGFKLVKGRGNFKCRKYAEDKIDKSCDEGRCIIEGYHCEHSTKNKPVFNIEKDNTCEYDYQKWIALNSDTVISNYPYLFLELNHVGDFEKRKLMIFDEAHNLEDNIMNQLQLEFTRRELKDEVSINLSKEVIDKLQLGNSSIWIKFILKVQNKYKKQLTKIKDLKNKSEIKEKISYYKRRIDDCDRFVKYIQHDPSKWIFDYDSYYRVAEFKPIKVNNYAKKTFFEYGDVCLFMSASILDYELFAEWLGIDKDEIYAIRQKSPFEINRNPIITYDNFNMSYNNLSRNAPLTINTVKDILETHKNDKGIIHTISYKCKDFLMKNLNSSRLIDHKTHNRIRQLNKFKKSNNPLVLISPSMNEGVDLPGDLCRFQIIYKIPYPSLADKQTKIRSSIDPKWYKYKTALVLVQTVGRGMRYEKDYCTTYFIDSRLLPFVAVDMAENNFLPDTFIDAINIEPAVIDESDDVFEEVSLIKNDLKDEIEDNSNIGEDFIADNCETNEFLTDVDYNTLTFYDKVDLKYDLCLKGSELLDNHDYMEAIEFYEDLLENELFINDYHIYLKLSKAYHSNRYYAKEVELIENFFKSGIYCSKSKINKFKKKLKKLDELSYYDYSKFHELEAEFERNGSKNKKLSGTPIPLAVNIRRGKKNINKEKIDYESPEFDDLLKMNSNLSYEEKINLKYKLYLKGKELFENNQFKKAIIFYNRLLNHELFINDYHPYLKLAKCYRKNHQYDKEVDIISKFFKSGIYCNDKIFKWFKKCLKQLYKYGNYDFSSFYLLENEFNQNGALNKDLSSQPVPPASIIKEIISLDISQMELNIDNNENKTNDVVIKKPSVYSREYFNKLAKEIQSNPDFVSDREISQHVEEDFIEIVSDYDKINKKADLINQGRELEKEDKQEAIKFYDSLKTNELFVHDYYPYRRQCILFKNKIKDDFKDLDTIIELFNHEIYCNPHQYIWLHNKLLELIDKLNLSDYEIHKIDNLLKNYGENEEKYQKLQNTPIPIAERIFKDENGLRLLSQEKYDFVQNVYYITELGVGYIRRGEYETAISYYLNLLESDILYYQYHAYKQLGRICKEMNNPDEFKRLYERLSNLDE